jgi:hypothetical protein
MFKFLDPVQSRLLDVFFVSKVLPCPGCELHFGGFK